MRPGDRIWCLKPAGGTSKYFRRRSALYIFWLKHLSLNLFLFSMETLDKKFEQVLALQQLDKSKAVSQILQEVKSSLFF